jgi:hypothetical protein
MKPVDQQVLHDAEHGIRGDCFRACLASILELPPESVPMAFNPNGWRGVINAWLAPLGLFYFDIRADDPMCEGLLHASPYHIITGPSPRGGGVRHAVVGHRGVIEHDPHPTRAGLLGGDRSYGFLLCQSPEVVAALWTQARGAA